MTPKITVYTSPTHFKVGYESGEFILGSSGKITTTYFTDRLTLLDNDGQASHSFFFVDEAKRTLHLPWYCLSDLEALAKAKGIEVQQIEQPLPPGKAADIEMIPNFQPKDARQAAAIEFTTAPDGRTRRPVAIQTGGGKFLRMTARLVTPNGGHILMRDVKIGDVLLAPDGVPTEVTGVYPQGIQACYEIEFEDGRKTHAGLEHLWKAHYEGAPNSRKWDIRTTEDLIEILSYKSRHALSLPLAKPMIALDAELPIDPYVLGYFLGKARRGYGGVSVSIDNESVYDYITHRLPHGLYLREVARGEYLVCRTAEARKDKRGEALALVLKVIGAWGKVSGNRMIPSLYGASSAEQKWELIRGLLDAAGEPMSDGTTVYGSTSEALITQVRHLLFSLGCTVSSTMVKSDVSEWYLSIRAPIPEDLFSVPNKKDVVSFDNRYRSDLKLQIKSITRLADEEMQCISVDHPDRLYMCDDYIVTHNTVTAFATAAGWKARTLVTMASNLDQWVSSFLKWTQCDPSDVYVVKGAASLRKLIQDIDDIQPKFIVGSTRTFISFMEFCDTHSTTLEQNGWPAFDDLMQYLGVGVRITDEYHWNIEANFTLDMRWRTPIVIPMTATFLNSNQKALHILDRQYPPDTRYGFGQYHKYIDIRALRYSYGVPVPRRVFIGAKGYSHAMLEEYILKHRFRPFMDFVLRPVLDKLYFNIRNPGERALILCSKVEMADRIIEDLKEQFQREGRDETILALYAGVDEEAVKSDSSIIVATLKKGGTGADIPDLRTVINTVAVASVTENEQNLGRCRVMKDPTITPIYAWLTWDDVSSQCEYFVPRAKHYSKLGLTFGVFRIGKPIT